jgi:hypothetical protein
MVFEHFDRLQGSFRKIGKLGRLIKKGPYRLFVEKDFFFGHLRFVFCFLIDASVLDLVVKLLLIFLDCLSTVLGLVLLQINVVSTRLFHLLFLFTFQITFYFKVICSFLN